MILTISERFRLIELLPTEGNIIILKRLQDLRNVLIPSESEEKEINLRQEGNQLMWDGLDHETDIPIGESVIDLITEKYKKLNGEDKLSLRDISLYEKFIPSD